MYMLGLSSSIPIAHIACPLSRQALQGSTTCPCYIAPGQTAHETSLPLSRVLFLPGKSVHRAVP
jgi:hypothetical protein